MVSNKTLIYKKIPQGLPVPGQDLVIEDRPLDLSAPPPEGGLVVEILYSSFDPYLRGRMRDPSIKSYSPAFTLGEPIWEDAIARVLATDNAEYNVGDHVVAFLPISQYARIPANPPAVRTIPSPRRIDNPGHLDVAHWLGALGMPGLTAYAGLLEAGQPKAGETLFVSSAAGAVGQIVGQVAKQRGLRVIGSVGSDEKLDFIIKELGYDAGFNYKKESPIDALPRLAPNGIDVYFENVGGDHLEAAVQNINVHGRIAVCGTVSDYNKPVAEKSGLAGVFRIVAKRIKIQGLLVSDEDFGPKYYQEHQDDVQKWLLDGTFKAKLSVTEGIENAAEGLVGMLQGTNFGKAVLKVK